MKLKITFYLLVMAYPLFAQQKINYLHASSPEIRISDDGFLQQGGIDSKLHPDIYFYHSFNDAKRIVYYTDKDSLACIINPSETFDFAVIFNGDTCWQRIAPKQNRVIYERTGLGKKRSTDTIPFVLGPNNAIHLRGSINGSGVLDLIFDTGANVGVLSDEGRDKGASLKIGNSNEFRISDVVVKNSAAVFVDYRRGAKADGVIGYNAFENKIVEIDYNKNILVVHDSDDVNRADYTAVKMQWRGENMFAEGSLHFNNRWVPILFLFDTGSKWALSVTHAFAEENNFFSLKSIGTREGKGVSGVSVKSNTVLIPQLMIEGLVITDVPADLESAVQQGGLGFNILGNDVLKRFNVILDYYRKGIIWLRPNKLFHVAYLTPFDQRRLYLPVALILIFIGGVVFIYRKRKRILKENQS